MDESNNNLSQSLDTELNTKKVNLFQPKPNLSLYKSFINYWREEELYLKLSTRDARKFVLHDGPPYANGQIHLGHAVNKILKDCINRIKAMSGFAIDYVTGWDCNGLPIEAKVESDFADKGLSRKQVSIKEFTDACRDFANYWISVQKKDFDELGILASEDYYTTIQLENQVSIVEVIQKFANRGLIYQKLRPILWSCEEETALAEAEIEYREKESNAIDCLMKIASTDVPELQGNAYVPIWTTTPWSLPSNQAIAYNEEFLYKIVRLGERDLIVSEELIEEFLKRLKVQAYEVIGEVRGADLANTTYYYPFDNNVILRLYHSDHVTNKQGTGFVHIALDHGLEDFYLGQKHGLTCFDYITSNGHFKSDMPESLQFIANYFFAAAEKVIIAHLGDAIVAHTKILHQYPHSWRSRKPVIFRATSQWFIDITELKHQGIAEAGKVTWLPGNSKERFISTLEGRESWCISRQRIWGTPICLFHKNGQVLTDSNVFEKTLEYLRHNGIQAWWSPEAKDAILGELASEYEQVVDIVDVWLESGSTQYFVLAKHNNHPADLYLEGSDQHRAFFQASMLVSLVTANKAPYKCVKTHGYVVDPQGRKMSKSLGNGKDPQDIINEFGADVLRIWTLNQNTSNDITFSMNQILASQKIENKIRNTLKFMITNAKDNGIQYSSLPLLEKSILHKIYEIHKIVESASTDLNLHKILHKIYVFCESDLSRMYFDIRKDVLYWQQDSFTLKQQVQSCLHVVFQYMIRWIAPFMPFAAEDAWHAWLERKKSPKSSIHAETFLEPVAEWYNGAYAEEMENLFDLRYKINVEIEKMRASGEVKSGIDCTVKICGNHDIFGKIKKHEGLLREVCIVSDLEIENDNSSDQEIIEVNKACGHKCCKCKRWYMQTVEDLCIRCYELFK